MTPKPIFARLATKGRLKDNQSALYQWFLKHHDQFAAVLVKIARPGWQSIADELSIEGLTMKDGRPITAAYARVTWWRAHKSYETKRPLRVPRAPVLAPRGRELAHGVSPVARDVPAADEPPVVDEPPTERFQFGGPATLRGHTPPPPPSRPPEPAPAPAVQDVGEVVARLLGKPRNKSQPE